MARPLSPFEKDRARAWMRERRGDTSQAALVEDIERATDWGITRDRYSKYESGGADFGRGVLERFVAYWTAKGQTGPDLDPPVPPPAPDLAAALMALAKANEGLTAELLAAREAREAYEIRLGAVEAELRSLRDRPAGGGSPEPPAPHETAGLGR